MAMLKVMIQPKKKKVMVETEMGKMAPKSEMQERESKMATSLDKAVASPFKMRMAAKEEAKEVAKKTEGYRKGAMAAMSMSRK